jgi:hypothetical protein
MLVARATEPPGGYPACLRSYIRFIYIVTRQIERITAAARQGDAVMSILDLYDVARGCGFVDRHCIVRKKGKRERGGVKVG